MVLEMGGQMSVTSAPGEGSCFVVRMPVSDAALSPRSNVPELAALHGRVLVIDDDTRVLGVLCRMLSSVHDLIMPDMNGMDFYRELARQSPELPSCIVFLSGGANAELAA